MQRVHGPHEAGCPGLTLLHGVAGSGSVELVAGSIIRMIHEPVLTLALRLLYGVVERQDVTLGTGSSGVELVALVGLGVVVHGQGGVAATEPHSSLSVHQDNVPQLTGSLGVLFIAATITELSPECWTGAGGLASVRIIDESVSLRTRTSGKLAITFLKNISLRSENVQIVLPYHWARADNISHMCKWRGWPPVT